MSVFQEIPIVLNAKQERTDHREPDTVELIRKCIANERSAQEVFYKKYYGKMMALCMRYLGNKDEAMDVLNRGFLKVFRGLENYAYDGPLEAWIRRIVYNSIIDSLRSRNKFKQETELSELEDYAGVNENAIQNLYAKDLMSILDILPEASRLVFNMFAIEGYKHEEIAEMLGISQGTSKWHVNQARTILKAHIEKKQLK